MLRIWPNSQYMRERVSYEYIKRNNHVCILFGSTHRNVWVLWQHMLGIYTIIHYQVRKRTWSHKIVPPDLSGERMHQCVPGISCNCSDGTSLHCVFKNHRRTIPLCIQSSSFHGNIEAGKDETMHNSARPKQKHRCNLPFHLNEPAAPGEWRWDCWTSGASRAVVEQRKLAKRAKVLYSRLIPCANIKQYHIAAILLTLHMKINT